jgi:hypothetical protein
MRRQGIRGVSVRSHEAVINLVQQDAKNKLLLYITECMTSNKTAV